MKKLVGSLIGSAWFAPALPWILGLICLASLAAGVYVGGLHSQIALLERDVAVAKATASAIDLAFTKHLQADETFLTQQLLAKAAKEQKERAERARIEKESKETRDALARQNDLLRSQLRSGAVRVRAALCPAAPETGAGLRGTGAVAGAPDEQPRSGADLVADAVGAGARKDADYAELLAIALNDRTTCGVSR